MSQYIKLFSKRNVLFSPKLRAKICNVAIIGGGVAGLQAARALQRIGKKVTIFEKNSDFGGVWHHNYDGASLQIELELYQFPEYLFNNHEPKPCGIHDYASAKDVSHYVMGYAKHFDLYKHARLNTKVLGIDPKMDTENNIQGWNIRSGGAAGGAENDNKETNEFYDYVCICTGMYNNPNLPNLTEIEGIDEYKGEIIHSSQFTNMREKIGGSSKGVAVKSDGSVTEKRSLMVIGGGKSAYDMVAFACQNEDLFEYPIHWYTRRPQWMISRKYLNLIKLRFIGYTRGVSQFGGLFGVNTNEYGLFRKYGQPLFWRLFEFITSFEFSLKKMNQMGGGGGGTGTGTGEFKPSPHQIWKDFFDGGVILDNKIFSLLEGKVAGYSGINNNKITKYDSNKKEFVLSNNKQVIPECDIMVCATGFNKSHYDEMFGGSIDFNKIFNVEKDGLYLYKHVLPSNVDRLAFIGAESTSWTNILTHFLQAEWLASGMDGKLRFSDEFGEMTDDNQSKAIINDVDRIKAYKRSFMNDTGSRAASLQLHMIGYHDELVEDMGLNPKRKSNILLEFIDPLLSKDYANIINEKQQ